jgi:hypothetical protein
MQPLVQPDAKIMNSLLAPLQWRPSAPNPSYVKAEDEGGFWWICRASDLGDLRRFGFHRASNSYFEPSPQGLILESVAEKVIGFARQHHHRIRGMLGDNPDLEDFTFDVEKLIVNQDFQFEYQDVIKGELTRVYQRTDNLAGTLRMSIGESLILTRNARKSSVQKTLIRIDATNERSERAAWPISSRTNSKFMSIQMAMATTIYAGFLHSSPENSDLTYVAPRSRAKRRA